MIKFKIGVKINWTPCLVRILEVLTNFAEENGIEIWITSGNDGRHRVDSLHYKDRALDVRTWNLVHSVLAKFQVYLNETLGDDYDVVYESTIRDDKGNILRGEHLHIEYDPKVKRGEAETDIH